MRVVEIETQHAQRRYVVMDENGELVEPIVRYLKYSPENSGSNLCDALIYALSAISR